MILVGNGRVGQGLVKRSQACGVEVLMVTRNRGMDRIDPTAGGPVLVCVNAGDIRSLVSGMPLERKQDLVFVQNGMIGPALADVGCAENTLGLLYFAVPRRGDSIQPGGTSLFCGRHAASMVRWFDALGLRAEEVGRSAYTEEMMAKLIWNCTFGLLCEVYKETVGDLVAKRSDEIAGLVGEFCSVANQSMNTRLVTADVVHSACEYSLTIPDYQGALKQWEWRNGWFVDAAHVGGIATPVHARLLRSVERPA